MKLDDRILFVIGAGRSGTTLLAELLGEHPKSDKLDEKRYLWMYGNYWASADERGPECATPKTRAYIEGYLRKRLNQCGAQYLIEKTPSNCFRIGFINALFPNAKYVHIVRDGREASFSSFRAFVGDHIETGPSNERSVRSRLEYLLLRRREFMRRFTESDLAPSGWIPYAVSKSRDVAQTLFSDKPAVWGARYAGIQADRRAMPCLALAAKQWSMSVKRAQLDLTTLIPESHRLEVRYEDLTGQPVATLATIFDFMGVGYDHDLVNQIAAQVNRSGRFDWESALTETEQDEMFAYVEPACAELGYV